MSTPVTLTGRLTRDPELTYSAKGTAVARFSVVTARRFKDDASGEWRERDVTFWDCVAFSQLAENVMESLEKGTAVIVTGNAYQEEWEAKDGTKRKSFKVTAEEVAPSLRFASAKIKKAERSSTAGAASSPAQEQNPWSDEPPF